MLIGLMFLVIGIPLLAIYGPEGPDTTVIEVQYKGQTYELEVEEP